jgi:hypothetical protein
MRVFTLLAGLAALGLYPATTAADLQPAQMQKDFDLLRSAMQEAHGGLYRFTPKADLDRRFDAARARFDRPMSPFAYYAILSETLAAIRDGHTRVDGDPESGKALNAARLFPLRVVWQDGGLVVSASGNEQILPGMRLVSINGKPVEELVKIIRPKISPDGFSETSPPRRLARSFSSLYWLLVDQGSTFAVRAQAKGGPLVTATLQGITAAELRKLDKPVTGDNVTLQFPAEGVGYLRIRGFGGADFRPSVTAAFQSLQDKKAKSLILDLRGNGGGADMFGAMLVSQFVTKSFRYFDHIRITTIKPSFATWKDQTFTELKNGTKPASDGRGGFLVQAQLHPGVSEQQPSATPFTGKVFVLIDGFTFSTAADVCAQLRALTKATFIGEETGGAAEGNTSGLNADLLLPESKMKVRVQMYGYWNANQQGTKPGRGTLPDVVMPERFEDVQKGVDAALDRAIALAK